MKRIVFAFAALAFAASLSAQRLSADEFFAKYSGREGYTTVEISGSLYGLLGCRECLGLACRGGKGPKYGQAVLDSGQQQHKIRFAFIDAPEKAQPFGQAAKKALSDKVYRQQVRVDILEQDKYGRSVGRVWLGFKGLEA